MRGALVEGEDYYLEDGRLVFTAAYHRKRGYCCNSKCRHCPYRASGAPPLEAPVVIQGIGPLKGPK